MTTQEGAELEATPVRYEPENDLAVLRIDARLPSLELAAEPESGTGAAVLGYPENGPYATFPARLGDTRETISEDSYGRGPIPRTIVSLRGNVRSGNSGGPVVDGRGRVLGTVFAATTTGPTGGFAIPNQIVNRALKETSPSVDTGPCVG